VTERTSAWLPCGTCHNEVGYRREGGNIFNFQNALQRWNGEYLSLADLQHRLSELRLEHLGEVAPEIGVRELLLMALDRRWIVEEPSGQMHIQVPEEVVA
jgi:hypothetical protein